MVAQKNVYVLYKNACRAWRKLEEDENMLTTKAQIFYIKNALKLAKNLILLRKQLYLPCFRKAGV